MAKLNWQNIKYKPQYDHLYDHSSDNNYDYNKVVTSWQNTSWPIKGKYHGTKLKELPLDYLQWVGLNFNTNSKGFKLALQELECRSSTHKVSGPDR